MYLKQKFVYQFLSRFFVNLFLFTPIFAGRPFLFCQFLHPLFCHFCFACITPFYSLREIGKTKIGKNLALLHRIKLTKKLYILHKIIKFCSANENFCLPIFEPFFAKILLILPIFQNTLFLFCQFLSILFCAFCITYIHYL